MMKFTFADSKSVLDYADYGKIPNEVNPIPPQHIIKLSKKQGSSALVLNEKILAMSNPVLA